MFLFFFKTFIFNFQFIDIFYRFNFDNSLFNSYDYFWTNFWYLPIYFFIILISFFFTLRFSHIILFLFYVWFLFYVFEINNYILTNFQFVFN